MVPTEPQPNPQSLEPQPSPKMKRPSKPFQKIAVTRMEEDLYSELQERAKHYHQRVPKYCRMVLEHAIEHRIDYEGPTSTTYDNSRVHLKTITIPLQSIDFLEKLEGWDPYGVTSRKAIAVSILKKHLEVRAW